MTGRTTSKALSIARLRVVFLAILVLGIVIFTGGMFALIDDLSRRFGPQVRADLEWRALRGVQELSRATDVGIAMGDAAVVTQAFGAYARSPDVQAIVAIDDHGKVVARHGDVPWAIPVFEGPAGRLGDVDGYLISWAPVIIEDVEIGRVAIVVSTRRLLEAESSLGTVKRITLAAGGLGLVLGVFAILFFTRAISSRDRRLRNYANNLEEMVERRTNELDERNREMRLVLDSVAQGFVMIDLDGRMASERSAIVDRWFGEPTPGMSLVAFVEPHAPEFAAWLELGLGTLRAGLLPIDLCLAQMPEHLTIGPLVFEIGYRTIMEGERLQRLLVIISDVTAQRVRERREREQREMLGVFLRISADRGAVDDLVTDVSELLAALPSSSDPVVQMRTLHTLKGNCAMFGLDLYSELCHRIEGELTESLAPLSAAQRGELIEGWQTISCWIDRLRGAARHDVVEIECADLAWVIERAEQGLAGPQLAALLAAWMLEPVARRFDRLAQDSRWIARRLAKAEPEIVIADHGLRLDGPRWAPFWAAATHAVRNALDHGIEGAEERVAMGKPAAGVLTFTASESEGWIRISIADDGRGISWSAIRDLACAAGLPHATQDDLVAALFADGITTRETISQVSGRGVGMAALQSAVRDLAGTIEVTSTSGAGTRVCCRFPRPSSALEATRDARRAAV